MKSITLYFLIFINFTLIAQSDWEVTLDFGDDQFHIPRAIAPTEDGGVMITGIANLNGSNQIFLSKFQSDGEVEFTNYHDTFAPDQGEDILFLSDGNFAILGVDHSISSILIYNKTGVIIEIIEHNIDEVSANKIIELENGDFLFAGSIQTKGDNSSSTDWQPYFSRINREGEIIWSKTIETDSEEGILDAIVFEDLIIGCGYKNDNAPTVAYAIGIELATGEFVWEKKENNEVYYSDIKKKGESIFITAYSRLDRSHVIEINKSGLTKRKFYSDIEPSFAASILMGENNNDFYVGENLTFGFINEVVPSKAQLSHYVDRELICEKVFEEGDINVLKGLTYTTDGNIAGIIEVTKNDKRFTQVFKTEKICDIVSTEDVSKLDIEIFPNPADDIIKVSFPLEESFTARLVNSYGMISTEKLNFNSDSSIDIARLPSGLYFLQLWSEDKLMHVEKVNILR